MVYRFLRPLARFYMTEAGSSSAHRYRFRTVAFAGGVGCVVGVTSVVGAGYGVYYYSNLKKAVDTLSPAISLLNQARKTLHNEKPSPVAALQFLRKAAKAYLAYIPGAGLVIDAMFNHIDSAVEDHAEEANGIIEMAFEDMNKIINHDRNKHETHTAMEIVAVCKRLAEDLGALSVKAARPYVDAFELDKKAQAIGVATGNVIEAVKTKSPEWKAKLDRTTEPVGNAVGSVVEAVKSNLTPDWKHSASVVSGAIRDKIHSVTPDQPPRKESERDKKH